MATLVTKLTLTSSNATSDTLNLTTTDTLTITEPSIPVARTTVTTTGANNIIQPATDGQTYYVYVKHVGDSGTLNVELTGDVVIGKLAVGEFMFMPVGGHSLGVQLEASASTIVAEYAYFTKG